MANAAGARNWPAGRVGNRLYRNPASGAQCPAICPGRIGPPRRGAMKAGLSTSVIGRGRTGIAQYVFGLVRGWAGRAEAHSLVLFVLEEDLPLFALARDGV